MSPCWMSRWTCCIISTGEDGTASRRNGTKRKLEQPATERSNVLSRHDPFSLLRLVWRPINISCSIRNAFEPRRKRPAIPSKAPKKYYTPSSYARNTLSSVIILSCETEQKHL